MEGGGGLPGQTDDAKAVGPVGGDLKFHDMVVGVDDGLDVIAGLAVLVEDEDTVVDAVGEFALLRVEVRQRADGPGFGVESYHIQRVDVLAVGFHCSARRLTVLRPHQAAGPAAIPCRGDRTHAGGHHRPENLVSGLDIRRDGGFFGVNGLVVVQQGGGLDDGIGEIPLVQAQLTEGAEHTVGQNAPQLALLDLLPSGEGGLVQGHGHQVAHVDIPRPGADLDGLLFAHVQLADPHVVAVGVALHLLDAAHHHVLDLRAQVLGDLHLGAGEGHGLRKLFITGINGDELAEPFAR